MVLAEVCTRQLAGACLTRHPRDGFEVDQPTARAALGAAGAPASLVGLAMQCLATDADERPLAENAESWLGDLLAETAAECTRDKVLETYVSQPLSPQDTNCGLNIQWGRPVAMPRLRRSDGWGAIGLNSWQTMGMLSLRQRGLLDRCWEDWEDRWCSLDGATLSWGAVTPGMIFAAGSVVVRNARVAPMGARNVVLRRLALGSTAVVLEVCATDTTRREVWLAALRLAAGGEAAPTVSVDWLEAATGSRKRKAGLDEKILDPPGITDQLAHRTLHRTPHRTAAASIAPALEATVTREPDQSRAHVLLRARVGFRWSARNLAPCSLGALSSALWHVLIAKPSLAAPADLPRPPALLPEAKESTDNRRKRPRMALDAYLQAIIDFVRDKLPLETVFLGAVGLRSAPHLPPSADMRLLVGAAAS